MAVINSDGRVDNDSGVGTSANDIFDFENASASDITNKMQSDSDWAKKNASAVDYWLQEKSYYDRRNSQIGDMMKQLKENGINPILAYQMIGNGSTSGGATSDSAGYYAQQEQIEASKRNANVSAGASIIRGVMLLSGVGLSLLLRNPAPLLASTFTTFGNGWSQTTRNYK